MQPCWRFVSAIRIISIINEANDHPVTMVWQVTCICRKDENHFSGLLMNLSDNLCPSRLRQLLICNLVELQFRIALLFCSI